MGTQDKEKDTALPDVANMEELFEIMYRYSSIAKNGEISHSLNNILVTLSIQHTMLKSALGSGNYEKAMDRVEIMGTAIKNLEEFSKALGTEDKLSPQPAEVAVNEIIAATLESARRVPSLAHCRVSSDLTEESDRCTVDVDSFRMVILSFLKTSSLLYSIPVVSVKSERKTDPESFRVSAGVKEGKELPPENAQEEISKGVGRKIGEIPLEKMKRVVQLSNKNVELSLPESGKLEFTLTIFPAP